MKPIFLYAAVCLMFAVDSRAEDARSAVDAAISRNEFAQAAELCEKRLLETPDSYCATMLARLYSWTQQYTRSVSAYDSCLRLFPDSVDCRVEKARVLGWAKKYGQALEAYEQAYARSGDKGLKRELEVKRALWRARPGEALNLSASLLYDKPGNQELLMDIGQLHSNSGFHDAASLYYGKLLAENPYNTAGQKALRKNTVQGEDFLATAGAAAWRATSTQRDTDVDRLTLFSSLSKQAGDKLRFSATLQRARYRYASQSSIYENAVAAEAVFRPGLFSGAGARCQLAGYEGAADSRDAYAIFAWHKFLDSLDISAAYEKENSMINRPNIINGLYSRTARLRANYYWNRTLQIGADYRGGSITDGNYYNIQGLDFQYAFTEEPRRLYVIGRAESWVYRKQSANYYAPGWYAVYSALAGYKHNFNSDLYYGPEQIYADLQLKYAADSNYEPLWQPSVRFHADMGIRTFLEATWNITSSVL